MTLPESAMLKIFHFAMRTQFTPFALYVSAKDKNHLILGLIYPLFALGYYACGFLYQRYFDIVKFIENGTDFYGAKNLIAKVTYVLESVSNATNYPVVVIWDYVKFQSKIKAYSEWKNTFYKLRVQHTLVKSMLIVSACCFALFHLANAAYLISLFYIWDMFDYNVLLLALRVMGPDFIMCQYLLEAYFAIASLRMTSRRLHSVVRGSSEMKGFNGVRLFRFPVPKEEHPAWSEEKLDDLTESLISIAQNLKNTATRFAPHFLLTIVRSFASLLVVANIIIMTTMPGTTFKLTPKVGVGIWTWGLKFAFIILVCPLVGDQVGREYGDVRTMCAKLIISDKYEKMKKNLRILARVIEKRDLNIRIYDALVLDNEFITFTFSTVILYVIINFQSISS